MAGKFLPPEPRFWAKVIRRGDEECWGWTGAKTGFGYGKLSVFGHLIDAHRFSYALHVGAIPAGLSVLHRCDNPECTNPRHLRVGTHADNVADMDAKGRRRTWEPKGERNPSAKLTASEVRAIRLAVAAREAPRALAARYGVSVQLIFLIKRRTVWAHLSDAEAA